jgi:NAD(P)-dependent dehydrogenase (short-subunit alcohol dehydrogenase family)
VTPGRAANWVRSLAALSAGLALGVAGMAGGALLLYMGDRVLSSAGFLMALALGGVAAGVWVGAPDGPQPAHRRMMGRWAFAVVSLVLASFVATLWLASPGIQTTAFGLPMAVVFLLAEPTYAVGALLAGLESRHRARRTLAGGGGVAVPALVGVAAGVILASGWLIPILPPGPVLLGAALLLAVVGSLELGNAETKETGMTERVVVVTGVGGQGQIGFAVAEAFAARGARVLIASRGPEVEERARELGHGVVAVAADLADPMGAEQVVAAVRERWGRLDVLVNVAGGLTVMKPIAETEPAEWRREMDANAGTTYALTRAALPLLRESGGVVVNFASPAGERAMAGLGAYSAAKAGVIALTRALALEEGPRGVRVNAVAPGLVDTAQNREWAGDPDAGEGDGGTSSTRPMVRREQVVDAVLFLASDAASGVNGEVLRVLGTRLS